MPSALRGNFAGTVETVSWPGGAEHACTDGIGFCEGVVQGGGCSTTCLRKTSFLVTWSDIVAGFVVGP